ncbi:MAG: hypothetical protein ACXWRE_14505, partial [Pseudobdellovibrionaceae bacterium]
MKYRIQQLLLLSFWGCTLAACASNFHVAEEYKENLVNRGLQQTSEKTVILFLVDGLPLSTFQEQLALGNLPQIRKYFIANTDKFYLARTTFPALIFPGVGALLTERTVDQNELYGNKILKEGESLDFESPAYHQKLNDLIRGRNIFARLEKKGL